jgi:hypothetical protein
MDDCSNKNDTCTENSNEKYYYMNGDPDHYDLQDLFGGVYIKAKKMWRFPKHQESAVKSFIECSSDSSDSTIEESDSDVDLFSDDSPHDQLKKTNRRDRLHRANSFNASDSSNEDAESIDDDYRRSRNPK